MCVENASLIRNPVATNCSANSIFARNVCVFTESDYSIAFHVSISFTCHVSISFTFQLHLHFKPICFESITFFNCSRCSVPIEIGSVFYNIRKLKFYYKKYECTKVKETNNIIINFAAMCVFLFYSYFKIF